MHIYSQEICSLTFDFLTICTVLIVVFVRLPMVRPVTNLKPFSRTLLSVSHLVRVELEHLEEVVEEVSDEELVVGEAVRVGGDVGAVGAEVAVPLEAPQQHHGEHGAVEDVAELALPVMRHQIVKVSEWKGHSSGPGFKESVIAIRILNI